jgi:hypothetical protein
VEQIHVNTSAVVHDLVDGEVVIINLETGAYYGLDGPGVELWQALDAGTSVDRLVDIVLARGGGDEGPIRSSVSRILVMLEGEGLIVREGSNGNVPADGANGADLVDFNLSKYTDLTDLLLLDPVHDPDRVERVDAAALRGEDPLAAS